MEFTPDMILDIIIIALLIGVLYYLMYPPQPAKVTTRRRSRGPTYKQCFDEAGNEIPCPPVSPKPVIDYDNMICLDMKGNKLDCANLPPVGPDDILLPFDPEEEYLPMDDTTLSAARRKSKGVYRIVKS